MNINEDNEKKIWELCYSCEKLIAAQRDFKEGVNVREIRSKIEITKSDLKRDFKIVEISLSRTQEIFRMCEEVAKLQIQLEQVQIREQEQTALIMISSRLNF